MSVEKKNRLSEEEALEEVERVGKVLKEPRWWQTLVKNQSDSNAVFELARKYGYEDVKPGSPEKLKEFIARLHGGMYIGPLETYDVQWKPEKIARDIWQNFFDGNGQKLDGIFPQIEQTDQTDFRIRIEGEQEYDFRKLLHFGGTSKHKDAKAAGGFGEGAKVAAFLLLRDCKVEKVAFGSGDWVLEYYLDKLPPEQYDKDIRGLHVRLLKRPHQKGNFVEFVAPSEMASSVQDARGLFYYTGHPDFENPTFHNKTGGFRYLGYEGKGVFYEAGQRRNVKEKYRWDSMGGITLWMHEKIPAAMDRDRGAYSDYEIKQYVLKPLVESMSPGDVAAALKDLEELWPLRLEEDESGIHTDSPLDEPKEALVLLDSLVNMAEHHKLKIPFGSLDIAVESDWHLNPAEELLFRRGYRPLRKGFARLGVPLAHYVLAELSKYLRREATREENEMIGILREFVKASGVYKNKQPEIWLFRKKDEANIIHGQYTPDHIWLSEEVFSNGFVASLVTYMHELTHELGGHDTEFAYTFGDRVRQAFSYFENSPSELARLGEMFKKLGEKSKQTRQLEEEEEIVR